MKKLMSFILDYFSLIHDLVLFLFCLFFSFLSRFDIFYIFFSQLKHFFHPCFLLNFSLYV